MEAGSCWLPASAVRGIRVIADATSTAAATMAKSARLCVAANPRVRVANDARCGAGELLGRESAPGERVFIVVIVLGACVVRCTRMWVVEGLASGR